MTTQLLSIDHPRLSADLRISTHSDGVVILDIHGGDLFSSNKVGARILELLDGRRTLDEIAASISTEFDAPAPTVMDDLRNFVGALNERGLLN